MLPGLEAADMPADAVEVGRIADAWGIKGWFKVLPYSADPEALFSSKCWFLLPSEKGAKTFDGVGRLNIKEAKTHSGIVVASAHAVDDRTTADALRGARVFIAKSSFPTPQKDEYYWVDLIGLTVVNREGLLLGQVRELLSTGPQTVLVIEDEAEGQPLQRMIPFVAVYVDDVDLVARRILVDWQPDY
ncbi:ribosome maturation factor RimM [Rhodoferax sp. U2-2l]|uniref:ribosome maturation factor RimM n=1 Tax=Rhodoferax sp. U2-2l TaxID=2884000 RepID=UPI001D0B043F|nr:ribosome maturation factor RimM [Rhodoferax sp. U2-2l]MCB8746724.1 ribosome maturation factor RimM [Rhodoferax sp. U2-2l]